MTDLHALITEMAAELDHCQQLLMDDRRQRHPLADRARAALAEADGPAVPDGREPASVAMQPSEPEAEGELSDNPDYRVLLIKLTSHMAYMQEKLEEHHQLDDSEDYYWYRESVALQQRVAGVLAEPEAKGPRGRPAALAVAPEEGGLEPTHEQISRWINANPVLRPGSTGGPMIRVGTDWLAAFADAARWGARFRPAAAPVPASERLPGPEDCDEQGRYWGLVMGCEAWVLAKGNPRLVCITHWLPANALPLPAPEVQL